MFYHLLFSVCSGSFRDYVKGPVWVTTGCKCSPDVLLFLLLPLFLCGCGLSLMVYCSDDPQLVLQWVMRVEEQVLLSVCWFSVHLSVEASVFFNVYCTVQ